LVSGTLGNYIPVEEFKKIIDFYRPLPLIGITQAADLPSVVVENAVGIHNAVTHFIETHGYRRIAFIRGPEDNEEAKLRYRAYADALAEHDISLDPNLVAPGSFNTVTGAAAIPLLLDEHKAEFEAIVAANDMMAFGALTALYERGLRVPEDVALAGFDDTKEAAASTPSLTTVRQPIYQLGHACIEAMIKLLAGEQIPDRIVLSTALVVRRSCGCVDSLIENAALGSMTKASEPLEKAILAQREAIMAEMVQAVGGGVLSIEDAGLLLDAFLEDVADTSADKAALSQFILLLDSLLRQIDAVKGPLNDWQAVISIIRHYASPHISNVAALCQKVEDILHTGRVVIGKMIQKKWAQQEVEDTRQNVTMSNLRDELILAVDQEHIWSTLPKRMSQLDFASFFLSFHDGQEKGVRWSRLALAYIDEQRAETNADKGRFPTSQLVPDDLFPRGRRYTWLTAPLDFGENEFGHIVLEAGPRSVNTYQILIRLISGTLQDSALVRQLDLRRVQMLTAAEISQAVTSILDLDDLIQNVVELVRERFDLYYVGLFLIEGAEAVLRAATGEAGQKMLEQGQKHKVGDDSTIGQCMGNHQAIITSNTGQEKTQFNNPHLPDTRSELALPMVGREGAVGALLIQSPQEKAFGEADVAIFQTIADQLANAIANARMYQAIQEAYTEVERQVQERTAQLEKEMKEREQAQEENIRLQQEVIEAQQQSIQELSTPIIPVFDGVIVMPLIGSIDTMRAQAVTRGLLTGIRENRAEVVILDITGVPMVDSGVAAYLNRTIQAARLKGAHAIVTGISEAVAETIVDLGIDWSEIETLKDLQTGLRVALQKLHR
jgi:anti-anti-sigma regulatory factor/putative methionine-R-sulfoxide reductase with GAF domain